VERSVITQIAESGNDLSRGHKKKERTFNQILDAAKDVFIQKGIDRTVITDIRDAAGISQGTFYNYFRSKEDVLAELGVRVNRHYREKIFAISDQYDDPAERFAVFGKLWLKIAHSEPDMAGLVVQAGDRMTAVNNQINHHLMAYLECGVESGRFEVPADQTTLDILRALGLSGIRLVLNGHTDSGFDKAFVALFLRALGLSSEEAEEIASRPAPEFPTE